MFTPHPNFQHSILLGFPGSLRAVCHQGVIPRVPPLCHLRRHGSIPATYRRAGRRAAVLQSAGSPLQNPRLRQSRAWNLCVFERVGGNDVDDEDGMDKNQHKIIESRTCRDEDSRIKRFIQKLRARRAGRSAGTLRSRPVLPPEEDASVSVGRVFLGSTLEFMQREYFSEPQPKRNQRDGI
jgi:hypothetical protein